jgi:hypothetical protein
MDFIIRKDIYGSWWHDFNNDATKINISDFEAVIDSVANTFIIQCKNGSNVPTMAISIANVKVVNQIVSNTPISFSGAVGLKNLLTSLGYTPYLQGTITGQVVVYRVGQVGVFTMTPTQFTNNFDVTGLGTSTMIGWALRNGNNGTKNQQGKFSLNKGASPYDVIGTLGGSANSVLIGHDHESAVFSNGRKGVNEVGTGGTFNGNILVEAEANQKIVKTSIKGQSNNGVDVPSEDGVGKNMPPYLIDVWVERVTELTINAGGGGGGGGAVDSVNGQTGVVIIPLDYLPLAGGTMDDGADIFFDNGSKLSEGLYDEGTFGNKGIARTCAVGYEDKWEAGEQYITETGSGIIQFRRFAFNVPTVDDDTTKRYAVGSYWQMRNNDIYICTDPTTGAAVWEIYSVAGIPNLTEVLTQGDRAYVACNGDYQFVGSDIATFLINDTGSGVPIFTVDGDNDNDFIINCVLKFQSFLVPSQLVGINGVQIYIGSEPTFVTSYDFNVGDFCELKKLGAKVWWLNVSNASNNPIPTKTSDLTNDGADGVNPFITLDDIPLAENGLPIGGTAGQILTKLDSTDYNAIWQENYADWTSVVKHRVKNDGTGLITKGTAVYVTSSNGTNMLVGKASNTSEATSSKTMGLMQTDIPTTGVNSTGFVITEGLLSGLNTAGQTAGDPVWLGVNGALIYGLSNKPYAPAHLVFIGIVTKVSAGSGEIFVKIQNGFELKEVHDVDLISNSPTNNQGLIYESATSLWKNKTIIEDAIVNGVTTVAPSQNAVFDALALKQEDLFTFKNKGVILFDDFTILVGATAGGQTIGNYYYFSSGAGASIAINNAYPNRTNQEGVVALRTGTTLSGGCEIRQDVINPNIFLGAGAISYEVNVNVETLSTLAQRFFDMFGFIGNNNFNTTNGVYFLYDEGGVITGNPSGSANWKCVTISASTRTFTTTSVAVTASAWVKLRIEINAAATSVGFYINDVLVATHTTNIPTSSAPICVYNLHLKQTGLTSLTTYIDYIAYRKIFTSTR